MYENGNKMRLIVLFALLVAALLMLAAPAMAEPSTPFVIDGWVLYENGTACDNPAINITNLNTGAEWQAETNASYNYYQIVRANGTDLNVSETLRFSVTSPGEDQSNVTEHTVNQTEVDAGGFECNITLKSTIVSCDSSGSEKNEFASGETVYAKGSGLAADTNYKLWIQDDPVYEGYALITGNCTSCGADCPGKTGVAVITDADGCFVLTPLWNISADAQITYKGYDIVADKQDDGDDTGRYNAASDGIDSASVAGIIAPVPELASIILFAVGLVMLIGLVRFRRGE
jgi:hypothetical protein